MVTDDTDQATAWSVSCTVPYDGDWSKNRMWRRTRTGRTYMAEGARAHRDRLAANLRLRLGDAGVRVAQNDLRVFIHIVKGDHRGDAINAIDLICDAVEAATGLNDRWYHVACQWTVGADPAVRVRIAQEDTRDVQICPGCHRRLPYDAFTKARTKTGRDGTCRECRARARKEAKTRV